MEISVLEVLIALFIQPVYYPIGNPPMLNNLMAFGKNFKKFESHTRYVSLLGEHVGLGSHYSKTSLKNKFLLKTNVFFALTKGKTRHMHYSTAPRCANGG